MANAIKMPAVTAAEQALNAALQAGFRITRHLADDNQGRYWHSLAHADGRTISIYTALDGSGRFLGAQGYNHRNPAWGTTRLAVRSLAALQNLLGR